MFKKSSPTVKKVEYALASDPSGAVSRAYGVWMPHAGLNKRGRFIINPDGVIVAMEALTPEVGRRIEESIRQVKAFQHVAATGEVTPAGWEPGKKTLTPGPDLAGKVYEVWKIGE